MAAAFSAQHCGRREPAERGYDPVAMSVDAETEHKLNNCSYGGKSQLFFWPIGFLSQLISSDCRAQGDPKRLYKIRA